MTSVNLGELRFGRAACPSDLALDRLAADAAPPQEADSLRGHIEQCSECEARMATRRQGFEAFPELDPRQPLRALRLQLEAAERPKPHERLLAWLRGPRWAYVTAGALAAAALAIMLLRGSGTIPDPQDGIDDPGTLRIKGGLALHVYRQQGAGAEELRGGDRFRPGDHLRFAVDLPRPGYISIVGVDAQGKQYVVWPLPEHKIEHKTEHQADAQRPAGKRQELLGGVTLDDSVGDESLYLIECPTLAALAQCQPAEKGEKLRCPAGCSTFRFKVQKAP